MNKVSENFKAEYTATASVHQLVCLTIDLWSSHQMRGYTIVTGHFILNLTQICYPVQGSMDIIHHVEETLAYFEVAKKISHIVTDNAANTTKAFAIPGYESDEGTKMVILLMKNLNVWMAALI